MRVASVLSMLSLLAAALLWSPAGAAEADKAQAPHHSWESRLQQRLGLTDDQVQKIRAIRTRDAEARKQHWQAMRTAQAELRRLVLMEADQPTIQAKQAEVQSLLAAGVEMRVKMLQEITPLLTPEQREALAQLRERHRHFRQPS
jgi:Spy/CpxP family protein refolding chaperone